MGSAKYTPLLPGIGFAGYRSFANWQEFHFGTKVTVLAGINNSGKSNVLRFLQQIMPSLRSSGPTAEQQRPGGLRLGDLDVPRGFNQLTPVEVGVPLTEEQLTTSGLAAGEAFGSFRRGAVSLLRGDDGYYWSRFTLVGDQFVVADSRIDQAISLWGNWNGEHRAAFDALGGNGSLDPVDVMRRVLMSLGGFRSLPKVVTITSSRRVETHEEVQPDWLSGRGIIRALAELQSPPHDKWADSRQRWATINRFLQTVLGDPDVSLRIPFDCSTIQAETPQRVLPLASLGSGVEQVIVLAAAATVTTRSLVCIEEPETNLHPLLQKKLVRYLTDETDNQYVIATHSSHLLDDARATAYHLRLTTEGTVARVARRPHELVDICHDLGYRPSDLLQANCVMWVEGPADRTYIRRWLKLLDPELEEGIDYSVMFYGGKLLAHLTASEEALDDFISLRYLNRSSAVVIDSDTFDSEEKINQTKTRIRDEFLRDDPAPGFVWVTDCYTIENYLPEEVLKAAVEQAHPKINYEPVAQWKNPLPKRADKLRYDKVGIANAAVPMLRPEHLDVFDLRARVTALRDFVRAANGYSIAPEPAD